MPLIAGPDQAAAALRGDPSAVQDALRWRLVQQQPVDPYLAWQLLAKELPASDGPAGVPDIPVLLELETPVGVLGGKLRPAGSATDLAPLWPGLLPPRRTNLAHRRVVHALTDELGLAALFVLPCEATLPSGAGVRILRFELGIARRRPGETMRQFTNSAISFEQSAGYDAWLSRGQTEAAQVKVASAPNRAALAPLSPLVCVIDDRCSYAHPAMGASISQLWHQGGNPETLKRLDEGKAFSSALNIAMRPGPPGGPVLIGFDIWGGIYGREREPAPGSRAAAPADDEAAMYRREGYIDPLFRWSHGSAVLDLVAAPQVWGVDARTGQQRWFDRKRTPPPSDIRFVQLPIPSVLDTSGGSLAGHALDGIRWAVESAQPGQKVIVNLSYGTHSGGHDGRSIWDRGLKELLDTFDGRCAQSEGKELHVVLPAGNSQLLRSHASAPLHLPGQPSVEMRWKVLPDNVDDSHLEVWLAPGMKATLEAISPDGSSLLLHEPGLAPLADPGNPSARPVAALVWPRAAAQSDLGQMALLAVGATTRRADIAEFLPRLVQRRPHAATGATAATATSSTPAPAPHGVWTLKITLQPGSAAGQVHAWVQRSDTAPGRGQQSRGYRGRQSYLLDTSQDPPGTLVDPSFTLNGIASLKHRRLHVVGAMRRMDGSLSAYSGAGPNRLCEKRFEGPDRVVAADESLNQPGLLVTGLISGSRLRVPGTSMAAAAYTRMLYEHLYHCSSGAPMVGKCPEGDTREHRPAPRGSATRADPMQRGEFVRLLPDNADGTLDRSMADQCAPAGAASPPCRKAS